MNLRRRNDFGSVMIIIYVSIKWFRHVIEDYELVRGWRGKRLREAGFSSYFIGPFRSSSLLEGSGLIRGLIFTLDGGDI